MKTATFYISITLILFTVKSSFSQSYLDGKFQIINEIQNSKKYTLYCFSRQGGNVRAKYFATNAYEQYKSWKRNKSILLVTAGAFSDSWEIDGKPVGLCVDNGNIINREPNRSMDGLVIVYNGSSQVGGIAIVDLDINSVKCEITFGSGKYEYYKPRDSHIDRSNFLNWGSQQGLTIFQTQLLYSKDDTKYVNPPSSNSPRERRFLAICYKNSTLYHVIIDAPDLLNLDTSTKNAITVLERNGFNLWYLLNLDTGGKNILHTYDGSYLKDLKPSSATIEKSTNLLIYYYE